jgi:hypothetical protein
MSADKDRGIRRQKQKRAKAAKKAERQPKKRQPANTGGPASLSTISKALPRRSPMIRMHKTVTFLLPSLVLLFALSGCGGENIVVAGGGGGISGTGATSGQIIGFGSVIVNGIKFTRKAGLADDGRRGKSSCLLLL